MYAFDTGKNQNKRHISRDYEWYVTLYIYIALKEQN